MNKVILMGRLTRDPEIRYSATRTAWANYTLAVDRAYKKEGEQGADFIPVVTFGKRADFAGKYFRKGMRVAVVGELNISQYTDRDGIRRWQTKVIAAEQYFCESREQNGKRQEQADADRSLDFAPADDERDPFSGRTPEYDGRQLGFDDGFEPDGDLPF